MHGEALKPIVQPRHIDHEGDTRQPQVLTVSDIDRSTRQKAILERQGVSKQIWSTLKCCNDNRLLGSFAFRGGVCDWPSLSSGKSTPSLRCLAVLEPSDPRTAFYIDSPTVGIRRQAVGACFAPVRSAWTKLRRAGSAWCFHAFPFMAPS